MELLKARTKILLKGELPGSEMHGHSTGSEQFCCVPSSVALPVPRPRLIFFGDPC